MVRLYKSSIFIIMDTTKNEFKVELPQNEDDLEEGALDRSEHAKRFK